MAANPAIRKILVVEDEPSVADTLGIILSTRGYQTPVAYSAEKAIEVIANWSPDLAIVDVMLPGMNGIDFSIIVKSNYPNCHILLFSGQPSTAALFEEAIQKGHCFEILAKPLHPDDILARIESLLGSNFGPLSEALMSEASTSGGPVFDA